MKTRSPYLLVVLGTLFMVFSAASVSFAQTAPIKKGFLSGDFNLNGGTNFQNNLNGNRSNSQGFASGRLKYSTRKFEIEGNASASYKYRLFGRAGADSIMVGQKAFPFVIDASADEVKNLLINSGIGFVWKQDPKNRFNVRYDFTTDKNKPTTYNVSNLTVEESDINTSFSRSDADNSVNKHKVTLGYAHQFEKQGRVLNADFSYQNANTSWFTEWRTGEGQFKKGSISPGDPIPEEMIKKRYRDTPYQNVNDIKARVKYQDKNFCNVNTLDVDFALQLETSILEDHKRSSTLVNGEWRDSTSVREDFLYITNYLTPSMHAVYKPGKFNLELSYSPELFTKRLDSESKTGKLEKGELAHIFSFSGYFTPWNSHSFFLKMGRNENRPDYIQICWFPRQSVKYSNEIYVGNPDLKNTVKANGSLGYVFSKKHFSATLSLDGRYGHSLIEQTYTNEVIDGRDYRVYTWVNGGKSLELGANLNLQWNDDKLKAAIEGGYNLYQGTKISGDVSRSGEYRFKALAEYKLKTWVFGADLSYSSDIVRTYSTVKSIAECNAHIAKSFGRFTITLDGNNLLDRPIETTITNDDGTEKRYEMDKRNLRIFVLGLHYAF